MNVTPTTDNPAGTSPICSSTLVHDEKPRTQDQILNAPLISVCMPVYNAKRYVGEAIESILGQTFGDFEFLIINDGSTDHSLAILERYAARDAPFGYRAGPMPVMSFVLMKCCTRLEVI